MIAAEGLAKSFGHYEVFSDVSFEVDPGDCYALFGPNGAGKTTLLKILATLLRPSSGRFEVDGFDGVREKFKVREAVLLLTHGSYLYDELTAEENLRFALGLRGLNPTDGEIKSALDRVGIGPFAKLKSRYLSAGMKRRLSIARAILIQPAVLLLDEGYSSLDERGVRMVNEYILDRKKEGGVVLITTHQRGQVAEAANRAGILRGGALKEAGIREILSADALF